MSRKYILTALVLSFVSNASMAKGKDEEVNIAYSVINFYCDVGNFLGGPIGVLVGMFIALYGFYKFIMSGSTGALGIILVGALVPAFPSLFAWFTQGVGASISEPGKGVNTAYNLNKACVYSGTKNLTAPAGVKTTSGEIDKEALKKLTKEVELEARADATKYYGPLSIDVNTVLKAVEAPNRVRN